MCERVQPIHVAYVEPADLSSRKPMQTYLLFRRLMKPPFE